MIQMKRLTVPIVIAALIFGSGYSGNVFSEAGPVTLKMKPGLWKMKIITEADGTKTDVNAEVSKALATLKPEQRKKILDNLSRMKGSSVSPNGDTKICYTKEMLADSFAIVPEGHRKNCDTQFTHQTAQEVKGHFKCNDGVVGQMEWKLDGPENLNGSVDATTKAGKKTHTEMTGTFTNSNCGSLTPKNPF